MIDLHTHLIPNVDDGADSIEETLRLANAAVQEGIRHTVLTPHHNRYWVTNVKEDVLRLTKKVEEEINKAGIPLTVSPSQEIRMNEEFIDHLFSDRYLPLDESGRYYLVEFSWSEMPSFAYDYLKQMIDAGITPVIAHPERQRPFIDNPDYLREFIEMGCISQITATSIVGGYSEEIRQTANEMMEENLIHTIASDAHNVTERPFNIQNAFDIIDDQYGEEYRNYLVDNAERIFKGKDVKAYEK